VDSASVVPSCGGVVEGAGNIGYSVVMVADDEGCG
jgi:hypothetical protein